MQRVKLVNFGYTGNAIMFCNNYDSLINHESTRCLGEEYNRGGLGCDFNESK